MSTVLYLLIYILGQAAFVTAVTQFLKRIPWIAANPRFVVAILNVAVMLVSGATFLPPELQGAFVQFLTAVIAAFGSVGAYEYVKRRAKPGLKAIL